MSMQSVYAVEIVMAAILIVAVILFFVDFLFKKLYLEEEGDKNG